MKNIINKVCWGLLVVATLGFAGCSTVEEPFESLDLARCLTPLNLDAKITNGENVTFSWDVTKGAAQFVLELYSDVSLSQLVSSYTVAAADVPVTIKLEADESYYFRVKAQSDAGKGDSNWAVFENEIKTYAVKDPLSLEIADRTSQSVTVKWVADPEVTHITVAKEGADETRKDLTAEEIAAAQATVDGLDASTYYVVTLYFKSANRGELIAWTRPSAEGATVVATTEAFLQAIKDKAPRILVQAADAPYVIGTVDVSGGVDILGEETVAGVRPVLQGEFHFTKDFTGGFSAEAVEFNGNGYEHGFAVQVKNGGGSSGLVIDYLTFKNCTFTGYSKGLMYEWSQAITLGSLTYESCSINDVAGSGGDGIDFRQATTIGDVLLKNNTIWEGFRTFLRFDANVTLNSLTIQNNTFCKVSILDDGNNGGLFNIKATIANGYNVLNNLFLYETGPKASLMGVAAANLDASAVTFAKNYFYNLGDVFWNEKCTEAAATVQGAVLQAEPCYNAEAGIFNLINPILVANEIGDPRWFLSYVEKEEDLTLDVISEAKTWDFADTKVFKGNVSASTVKDNLLFRVAATPISIEDGVVVFSGASTVGANGVPTDGALEFKVSAPGSVFVRPVDVDGVTGNHVTVRVNGVVKGGAAANVDMGNVQKILVSDITEESTISISACGQIGINALAWSFDTTQINTGLPVPAPALSPETVNQGEAQDVTISWEPIANAASYSVVFNGKTYVTEEPTYVVGASTIQYLDAGSYVISVFANPGEQDIYYTQSTGGNITLVVGDLGGGGGQEEAFSVGSIDELMSAIAAGKTDITLAYSGSPYDFTIQPEQENIAGGVWTLGSSLHLTGELSGSSKPVIIGSIKFAGESLSEVTLENLAFNGNAALGNCLEVSDAALAAQAISVINCDFYDYSKSLFYNNVGGSVKNLTFKGLYAHNMGTGQDGIDLRKGVYDKVTLTNSTLANGFREVFRIDLASGATICNNLIVTNNTLHNVSDLSNRAFFYVRAIVSNFRVENNLFLYMGDNALLARGINADVHPYFANNFFYNMGAAWFNNIDQATATANGGVVLSEDPVADVASGNYTLTNALLMSNRVGDPRWNPSADMTDPTGSFTVGSVADMLNAIAAGKSDITLTAAGSPYDFVNAGVEGITDGVYIISQDLTLRGESGAEIIGSFKIAGDVVRKIKFSNLRFNGNAKALGSFLEMSDAAVNATSIQVEDCEVFDYNKSLYYDNTGGKVTVLAFNRLLAHDMGAGQDGFDIRKGEYGAVSVENSTLYNGFREVFRVDLASGATLCNTLRFKNNTVHNTTLVESGNRAFFYVRAMVKNFQVENNLFMNIGDVPTFFRALTVTETESVVPQFKNNYFYNVGANWWTNMTQEAATANGGVVLTANPVKDASTADFTLTSGLAMSSQIGDPRWNPTAGTVTTDFTASSVEDLLNGIAAGKTQITLAYTGTAYDLTAATGDGLADGTLTLLKDLTLVGQRQGANVPEIIGSIKFAGTDIKNVVFKDLKFNGNALALGSCFEIADATVVMNRMLVSQCEITGFNKSIYYDNQGGKAAILQFESLLVHDMGTGQDGFDIRKGEYGAVIVQNSTLYNGLREVFRIDLASGATKCNSLTFKNNTVSNTTIVESGTRAFFYVRSMVAEFVVANNLFMNQTDVPTFFRGLTVTETESVVPQFTNNYFFNVGANWWTNMPMETATANGGALLTEDPCPNAASYLFTVANADVKAAGVGDPRWL